MLLADMSEHQSEPLLSSEQRDGAEDAQDEQVCIAYMRRRLAWPMTTTASCVMSTMHRAC